MDSSSPATSNSLTDGALRSFCATKTSRIGWPLTRDFTANANSFAHYCRATHARRPWAASSWPPMERPLATTSPSASSFCSRCSVPRRPASDFASPRRPSTCRTLRSSRGSTGREHGLELLARHLALEHRLRLFDRRPSLEEPPAHRARPAGGSHRRALSKRVHGAGSASLGSCATAISTSSWARSRAKQLLNQFSSAAIPSRDAAAPALAPGSAAPSPGHVCLGWVVL